jgi:hypothetical protein
MINWTPEGFIGNLFATMKPYAPPPPPGAEAPPRWGDEQHVRALFGDRVTALELRRRTVCADFFGSAKPDHGGRVQAPRPLPSSGTATPEDYDLRPQQAKT